MKKKRKIASRIPQSLWDITSQRLCALLWISYFGYNVFSHFGWNWRSPWSDMLQKVFIWCRKIKKLTSFLKNNDTKKTERKQKQTNKQTKQKQNKRQKQANLRGLCLKNHWTSIGHVYAYVYIFFMLNPNMAINMWISNIFGKTVLKMLICRLHSTSVWLRLIGHNWVHFAHML